MDNQRYTNSVNPEYLKWLTLFYRPDCKANERANAEQKLCGLIAKGQFPDDPKLQYRLGAFFYDSEAMHSEDPAVEMQAIELLELAIDGGCSDAESPLHLIKATHQRHSFRGSARSRYILGCTLAYENLSSKQAGRLLKKAANQGYPRAEYMYARCLLGGCCGVKKDYLEAFDYSKRAFDHGQTLAAYNLGCFYDAGLVVALNREEAKRYWTQARNAGHPMAAWALAQMDEALPESSRTPEKEKYDTAMGWLVTQVDQINREVETLRSEQHAQKKMAAENHALVMHRMDALSKDVQAQIDQLSDVFKKQLRHDLDAVKEDFTYDFRQFELLTEKMNAMQADIDLVGEVVLEDNKKLDQFSKQIGTVNDRVSGLSQHVQKTNENLEIVTARMQEFFDAMEQTSIHLAQAEPLQDLNARHEAELQALFGNDWKGSGRLLDSTRQSLLAARVLLDCARAHTITDCRGIIISATSALERELKARFYDVCRDYFLANGFEEQDLPEDLREARTFTMGSVHFILSCEKFRTGEKLYGYYTDEQVNTLRDYLRNCVISDSILKTLPRKGARPEDVFTFAPGQADSFTKKIHNIVLLYRNPAAHAGQSSLDTAENCCKEVIGPREELKAIEGVLLELLKLTANFRHQNTKA